MNKNTDASNFPYSSKEFIEAIKFDRESKLEKIRFETARLFVAAAIQNSSEADMDKIIKHTDEFISKFDINKL